MADALINIVSIVVFVGVLVWLMRQSKRSLTRWHSGDGRDFVAHARSVDDSGTPTRWKVVRAHLDETTSTVSLLPRGRASDVRGSFILVGRPAATDSTRSATRFASFVLRGHDHDVVVRVARGSLPAERLESVLAANQ
ncbi:MAG: hypothetical protein ACKOQZ_00245 [Actinomycetota bacterium]